MVRLSVNLSVCRRAFSHLNHLTYDLDFLYGVDLDLDQAGIVSQGCRSKVKVKRQKPCFGITVTVLQVGQGQITVVYTVYKTKPCVSLRGFTTDSGTYGSHSQGHSVGPLVLTLYIR